MSLSWCFWYFVDLHSYLYKTLRVFNDTYQIFDDFRTALNYYSIKQHAIIYSYCSLHANFLFKTMQNTIIPFEHCHCHQRIEWDDMSKPFWFPRCSIEWSINLNETAFIKEVQSFSRMCEFPTLYVTIFSRKSTNPHKLWRIWPDFHISYPIHLYWKLWRNLNIDSWNIEFQGLYTMKNLYL